MTVNFLAFVLSVRFCRDVQICESAGFKAIAPDSRAGVAQ